MKIEDALMRIEGMNDTLIIHDAQISNKYGEIISQEIMGLSLYTITQIIGEQLELIKSLLCPQDESGGGAESGDGTNFT